MTVERHPGFHALVSPTKDWQAPADGPFAWVRYSQPDTRGMAECERGFADTRDEAMRQAGIALTVDRTPSIFSGPAYDRAIAKAKANRAEIEMLVTPEVHAAFDAYMDRALYGASFRTADGKRIDPRHVTLR